MPNKTTAALTLEQCIEMIDLIRHGNTIFPPNDMIATALETEANLGMRIGDILQMKRSHIILDGGHYRLNIREEKTGKVRIYKVPDAVVQYLDEYRKRHGIGEDDLLFPVAQRTVNKYILQTSRFLGYKNIGSHSFRKFFGRDILAKGGSLAVVREAYQHSSLAATQHYLGVSDPELEKALEEHTRIMRGGEKPGGNTGEDTSQSDNSQG